MRLVKYRGKWTAEWIEDGRQVRRSLRCDASGDNRVIAEQRLRDLDLLRQRSRVGNTIHDIYHAYIADSRAVSTDRPRYAWKALADTFGQLRPDQVDRDLCRRYTAQRIADGRQIGTARTELIFLSAALNWHDKASGAVIELPRQADPRDRVLTREEFRQLLAAAEPHPHLHTALHLLLGTGARIEAILTLSWMQVSFERRQIWLGRKPGGKKRATVPMTKSLEQALLAARKIAETEFVVEYAGARVASVKKSFRTAVKKAGIAHCTPHDLRHSAAVWMAEDGVPMSEISQFLGHSSTQVTERVYARYSPDYLRGAANALEL